MDPARLTAADFVSYPPLARKVALDHLTVFQQAPVSFLAALLRELIVYDWKFPAERRELDSQLAYLTALSPDVRQPLLEPFARIRLSPALDGIDWVREPREFSEAFSAHLWATHQIDAYRSAAVAFFRAVAAPPDPLPLNRVVLVSIGAGVKENRHPLFRKLRRSGTSFTRVSSSDGLQTMLAALRSRAASHPIPYAHWYLDGAAVSDPAPGVSCVSYGGLTAVRARLQQRMEKAFESAMGSEAFRSMLARIQPDELGLAASGDAGLLNRFQVTLLTEGSGTQIYSTVFVQWAAREILRRARPLTLLARFTPRQRERAMTQLLSEAQDGAALDPAGSLVDADMGAYYTWINLRRLHGAEQARFLVWFEDHQEALAVAPRIPAGAESNTRVELRDLVDSLVVVA